MVSRIDYKTCYNELIIKHGKTDGLQNMVSRIDYKTQYHELIIKHGIMNWL